MKKIYHRLSILTLLISLVQPVSADVIYFNEQEVFHFIDECHDTHTSSCDSMPYYIHTDLTTGSRYSGLAHRTTLSDESENIIHSFTYSDLKGEEHSVDELLTKATPPLHRFSYTHFYTESDDEKIINTNLNFKTVVGSDSPPLIWIYNNDIPRDICGTVLSFNIESGVLNDTLPNSRACLYMNLPLTQAYSKYVKLLQEDDSSWDVYSKLRSSFPKNNTLDDTFGILNEFLSIQYTYQTPKSGKVEITQECGNADIILDETQEGTLVVHFEYNC